jgi:hypothetical protein
MTCRLARRPVRPIPARNRANARPNQVPAHHSTTQLFWSSCLRLHRDMLTAPVAPSPRSLFPKDGSRFDSPRAMEIARCVKPSHQLVKIRLSCCRKHRTLVPSRKCGAATLPCPPELQREKVEGRQAGRPRFTYCITSCIDAAFLPLFLRIPFLYCLAAAAASSSPRRTTTTTTTSLSFHVQGCRSLTGRPS